MASARHILSQIRTRRSNRIPPLLIHQSNLVSKVRNKYLDHRWLSTATKSNEIYRGRKRGRNQLRSFSNTYATGHDNHQNDDMKTLQNQLDNLLFEDTGKSLQYQNVWKLSPGTDQSTMHHHLHPLDSDKKLDRQSRFVLELLQTLQQVGLTNTSDRITTERCNAILNQLATPQSPTSKRNKSRSSETNLDAVLDDWQRIERATAILNAMESYIPLQLSSKGQIPTELPCPSHDTYFAVLRMYSAAKQLSQKELDVLKDDSKLSNQNLSLLETANEAPLVAKAIVEHMESSGDLALVPTSLHWNQVLSCYANAIRRPNRPVEAATLLYESRTVDASSFAHALRACNDVSALEDYQNYTLTVESNPFWKKKEAFAKLALAVAQRVWNGLELQQQQQDRNSEQDEIESSESTDELEDVEAVNRGIIPMNSHHFVHMLKAGRNFATHIRLQEQESDDFREEHQQWMRRIFEECCRHQKVNIHVLQEILYQGAVLGNTSNEDGNRQHLDWVQGILLSQPIDESTNVDVARFRSRWDSEILPNLVQVQESASEGRTSLQSVYAHTRQQTRILTRFIPSRWRANAD